MNRHVALVGALTALALLLPATASVADTHVQFISPKADRAFSQAAEASIEVRTVGDSFFDCPDPEQGVLARLADVTGELVSDTELHLTPQGDCQLGNDWTQIWVSEDPLHAVTLAPFTLDGPVCNGGYRLQAETISRRGDRWQAAGPFALRLPPSPPSDVSVEAGVERATVEWSPAPEPDVTGYRILRGDPADPDWQTVVGPDVTTVEDTDAPAGEQEYRVATLRADGLVDDEPAEPCSDDGQDLQTASAAVPATVRAPATESETATETESETATETTSPEATRTPTPTPDDAPEPEPEPVPVETTDPEPTEVETTESEYDEQLDFSRVGPTPSEDDPDGGAVALDVPGGSSEMDQLLGPILQPVAGGMILLAFALHLRRWSRDVW